MTDTILLAVVGLALAAGAAGAEVVERELPVAPSGTLRITLERGAVDVTTHDANVVRVSARVAGPPIWRPDVDLHPAADGESIELAGRILAGDGIIAKAIAWGLWPFRPTTLKVQVAVPRDYSVLVRTTGGRIGVSGIHGYVTAETSGGAIEVREVAGNVDAKTAGGRIEVAGVDGRVRAHTSGGAVTIERVTGPVEAETAGGRIDVLDAAAEVTARTSGGALFSSFSGAPHGRLETSGGSIEVRVPAGAGADLDAQTWGGRVEVAETLLGARSGDPHHVVGRLNGGGSPLWLRTSGGSIFVGAR